MQMCILQLSLICQKKKRGKKEEKKEKKKFLICAPLWWKIGFVCEYQSENFDLGQSNWPRNHLFRF